MADDFDKFLAQFPNDDEKPKKKKTSSMDKRRIAEVLNDEFSQLGYDDESRFTLLANIGRENSYNANTIFGGHNDPDNKAFNRGIISWQGSRSGMLNDFIRKNGGDFTPSENNLRLMARFMDDEMKRGYKKTYQTLRNPQATRAQKARALRDRAFPCARHRP